LTRWQYGNNSLSHATHTAESLAKVLDATIEGQGEIVCTGVAAIDEACDGDVTFMVNRKYARRWGSSKASIGIVTSNIEVSGHDPESRALLRVDDADLAIAKVLDLFNIELEIPLKGIHETAVVDSTASIGEDVSIGPHVVIAEGVTLGDEVVLYNSVYLGKGVSIGRGTMLRTNVVIEYDCIVGDDCILNAHVVIGADGFGYRPNEDQSGLVKMPHIGNVVLGDRVEIGANSCIDRGKFSSTTIGTGTKIDNLVQIGHNVVIGNHCAISALVGIGGSVKIGHWVQLGAQAGIAPHCVIGDGVKIGAKSGLMHDIPAGEEWLGVPAGPMKDTLRQWAITRKMPQIAKQFGLTKDQ